MRITQDPVNSRYVIETKVDLPKEVSDAYSVVARHYVVDGVYCYMLPYWLPNLQHLIDYILDIEVKEP